MWDKIWIPDTYFSNEKKGEFHSMTKDNRLLKVNNDGGVWYVSK